MKTSTNKDGASPALALRVVRRARRPHPMKGFRYIKPSETFQIGDQFHDGPHGWQTMGDHMAGVKNDGDNLLVRTRRLASPNDSSSAAGVEKGSQP